MVPQQQRCQHVNVLITQVMGPKMRAQPINRPLCSQPEVGQILFRRFLALPREAPLEYRLKVAGLPQI